MSVLMQYTRYIPKEKFQVFHDILCATGGRYVRNPLELFNSVEVCYTPGEQTEQAWERATKHIVEKMSNQTWKCIARRIGFKI